MGSLFSSRSLCGSFDFGYSGLSASKLHTSSPYTHTALGPFLFYLSPDVLYAHVICGIEPSPPFIPPHLSTRWRMTVSPGEGIERKTNGKEPVWSAPQRGSTEVWSAGGSPPLDPSRGSLLFFHGHRTPTFVMIIFCWMDLSRLLSPLCPFLVSL